MELQISYCICPKISAEGVLSRKRTDIGKILRQLCEWKGVKIIEAEVCPDHIHMLVEIPPKYSVSGVMGYLKGKSSLMIFEKYANLKYKYGNRQFWCRGYYGQYILGKPANGLGNRAIYQPAAP